MAPSLREKNLLPQYRSSPPFGKASNMETDRHSQKLLPFVKQPSDLKVLLFTLSITVKERNGKVTLQVFIDMSVLKSINTLSHFLPYEGNIF